jgi:hypothetical protein
MSGRVVELALARPPAADVHRAALGVPQPLIGAERPVEPHRVIDGRGQPPAGLVPVRLIHGPDHPDVGDIAEHRRVPQRRVVQAVPQPHPCGPGRASRGARLGSRHGGVQGQPAGHLAELGRDGAVVVLRRRRSLHRGGPLMVSAHAAGEPAKRREHDQPGNAVLVRRHLAKRRRPAAAELPDGVLHRPARVSGRHEIRVQRAGRLTGRHRGSRG